MSNLSHLPLCRLLLPFLGGILLFLVVGYFFSLQIFLALYLLSAAIWLISVYAIKQTFSNRWLFGSLAFFIMFVVGYHIAQNHYEKSRSSHFSHFANFNGKMVLMITDEVSEKTNSFRVITRVKKLVKKDSVVSVRGRLLLYLQKDSLAAELQYGDILLVENQFQEVQPPKNPYQFNFQKFLAYKNIYHQAYRSSGNWYATGENRGNLLKATALNMRQSALSTLKENNIAGDEFAVVSALLFGYTEYLNEDLMQEYSGSGAMHLLSVSGLHVGIIYVAIKYLLSFLNVFKHGKLLKAIFTVLFIWIYAAVTGFSPSVLRAGTMFTFLAIGQSLGRNTNIYNTLAGSAFVLLCYDPYLITQIGFQLSYLAVIAIVALQPPMYKLFTFKNKIIDWLWALTTVSITAQLVTGPIAMYYFDQFPNYFLITNLIVVPLSTMIIYLAMATLGLAAIPIVGEYLGKAVAYLVYAMNHSVRFIEGLPYSTFSGVHISILETLCVLAMGLFLGRYFLLRKNQANFVGGIAALVLLIVSITIGNISAKHNNTFIVYDVPRSTAIEFIKGRESVILMCEKVIANQRSQSFNIHPLRVRLGMEETTIIPAAQSQFDVHLGALLRRENWVKFGNKHIFKLNPQLEQNIVLPTLVVDYLIVSQNPRHNPKEVLDVMKPKRVILDSSNHRWTIMEWEEAALAANIPIWTVSVKGAYKAML